MCFLGINIIRFTFPFRLQNFFFLLHLYRKFLYIYILYDLCYSTSSIKQTLVVNSICAWIQFCYNVFQQFFFFEKSFGNITRFTCNWYSNFRQTIEVFGIWKMVLKTKAFLAICNVLEPFSLFVLWRHVLVSVYFFVI